MALKVWDTEVIRPLGQKLVQLLLEVIDQDRTQNTTSVPIEAVRGTILSFVEVGRRKSKKESKNKHTEIWVFFIYDVIFF